MRSDMSVKISLPDSVVTPWHGRVASRSASPAEAIKPVPKIIDVDPERRRERERQLAIRLAEEELKGDADGKPKEDPKLEVGYSLYI